MAQSIRRILAPTDFSDGSRGALEHAVCLAEQLGSELVLLHVGDPVDGEGGGPSPRLDIYHRARAEQQQIRQRKLDALVSELADAHPDIKVDGHILGGVPHEVICTAAEALKTDMIVMGTSGLTGLSHFLIGSTAERVVRVARVPVLTVRAS